MTAPAPSPEPAAEAESLLLDVEDALDFADDDPDDALSFFADLNDGEDWGWEP